MCSTLFLTRTYFQAFSKYSIDLSCQWGLWTMFNLIKKNTARSLESPVDECLLRTLPKVWSLKSSDAYQACAPSCSCSSPQCNVFRSQSCRRLHCRPGKSPTPEPWTRTLPTGEADRSATGEKGGVELVRPGGRNNVVPWWDLFLLLHRKQFHTFLYCHTSQLPLYSLLSHFIFFLSVLTNNTIIQFTWPGNRLDKMNTCPYRVNEFPVADGTNSDGYMSDDVD